MKTVRMEIPLWWATRSTPGTHDWVEIFLPCPGLGSPSPQFAGRTRRPPKAGSVQPRRSCDRQPEFDLRSRSASAPTRTDLLTRMNEELGGLK